MAKRQANRAGGRAARGGLPAGVLDVWGGGQLLAFSGLDGPTPYRHSLVARTAFRDVGLLVKIPDEAELHFAPGRPRKVFLTGDVFDIVHAAGRTRGAFLDAAHLLIEGPCRVRAAGAGLTCVTRDGRTLIAAAALCDPALIAADLDEAVERRMHWIKSVPKPRLPAGLPRKTLWKCLSVIKTNTYAPDGAIRHRYTTPDRWPHRGVWLWDSAFNAIGIRHLDAALARDAVEAVLDNQWPDGLVQISVFQDGRRSEMTQPPTLAMAAGLIHDADPAGGGPWLRRIYPKLAAYLDWDMAHRDVDGAGLLEWAIEPNRRCRCGESGWDNSPRFDCALPLDAVDFNSLLAVECEQMARLADLLDRRAERRTWAARHRRLCRLINRRLWNEDLGIYVDCEANTGRQRPMLSAAGLLPLACGAPTARQARRLARHLRDPASLGTPLPVPTVSPSHADMYSKDMWRGPVWVNVNWLIARGLDRYRLRDEAVLIRRKTLAAVEKYYGRHGAIFEFFDDEDRIAPPDLLRKTLNDPSQWIHQVIHDYMWTATLYVDMRAAAAKTGRGSEPTGDR